jgi:hypothetical protein
MQTSKEVYFNSNVVFDDWITFGKLRICELPRKTKIAFNIVLIFKENYTLNIGCVMMNVFSSHGSRFKTGFKDLNVWPFYEIDERLGCMKEYNGLKLSDSK